MEFLVDDREQLVSMGFAYAGQVARLSCEKNSTTHTYKALTHHFPRRHAQPEPGSGSNFEREILPPFWASRGESLSRSNRPAIAFALFHSLPRVMPIRCEAFLRYNPASSKKFTHAMAGGHLRVI
jgi:hypothetical protein